MRQVTKAEAWKALAKEHGFLNPAGQVDLGRFIVEVEGGGPVVVLITPLPASVTTADLRRKTPPIMFDRTPTGNIIVPGRWWADMFEQLSDVPAVAPDMRRKAAVLARKGKFDDIVLPADVETIAMRAPDDEGNLVLTEALPPGVRFVHHVTSYDGGSEDNDRK